MFKAGMTMQAILQKIDKLSWIKFVDRVDFESGETNLIYSNGDNTICFYFDNNKRLVTVI